MPSHDLFKSFRYFTHSGHKCFPKSGDLIVEAPLEIIINQERHILIMLTPQMIKELVVGFVFTEGLINEVSQIEECTISPVQKNDGEMVIEARIMISSPKSRPLSTEGRRRLSYSSCGICGTEDYYDLRRGLNRVKSRHRFSMDIVKSLLSRLEELQPLYKSTGATHAAALFDSDGTSIISCEDIGRHNALDKVIGSTLIKGIPSGDKILVSSGRASLEMILKTARAGFPVFVALSRPTSSAVTAAKFYNITLIDLARNTNRIYTHVRRIQGF